LSLEKTKIVEDLEAFMGFRVSMLMLKLDGLTVELDYDNGILQQGSTRGDGEVGDDITHNIAAFKNVPLKIPYRDRLVVTGEAIIHRYDFEKMKDNLLDSNGKPYRNARNLASGSVRLLDAGECSRRNIHFLPFNVLEGLNEDLLTINSKYAKLEALHEMGFGKCDCYLLHRKPSVEELEQWIEELQAAAEKKSIPIDGIVLTYNDIAFSKACGRTGHHYKDGKAFKFEDEMYETKLNSIEWNPTRSGEIAPVAIFDTVEIDGCDVSRASLHNVTFIKNLELKVGCRVLVSKRNMIIPHIEDNLDRGEGIDDIPPFCPCCGAPTKLRVSMKDKDHPVETLLCENPFCAAKRIQQFVHFVSKKAINIEGMSEATLEKFIDHGWVRSFTDIYHLNDHRDMIITLEGFGIRSYDNLWEAIEKSRKTSFEHFLVAVDIPMIGRTASRSLSAYFGGDLEKFEEAVGESFDFTQLEDFGEILNRNIHQWFDVKENYALWKELKQEMKFEKKTEENENIQVSENPFAGRVVVVTGTLVHFTRNSIQAKIESLEAKAGNSVSKNTDFLIAGEKAGSKLAKARELGITTLSESDFLRMIGE
jgi:DNA ligase (NAD+)